MNAKPKKYWNLFVKEAGQSEWSYHFGDYDREVVKEEAADVIDSNEETKTWIIQSLDSQEEINRTIQYVKGK